MNSSRSVPILALALVHCACGDARENAPSTPDSNDEPAASGPPWFEDHTRASGIDFVHDPGPERFDFPEIVGSGLALFDYDSDGFLDLYAIQSGDLRDPQGESSRNRLYKGDGAGHFSEVTDASGSGDRGYGMGCAVADYDADGDEDLYITNVGRNTLLRNEGDGRFVDVTDEAGVGSTAWGLASVFFDADGDGDLDLFVVNYVGWSVETELVCQSQYGDRTYCEPINYKAPAPDVLYVNQGDGTFLDRTKEFGLDAAFGNGMGVAAGDFDGDGRADLYVANDGTTNQLWLNRGERFEESSLLAGCAVNADGHAEASMGVSAVDVDEDGDVDLFMTHLRGETNTLYLNQGGNFLDRTSRSGTSRASLRFTGFGTVFADFDLDGALDLYVVNGRVGLWKPTFDDTRPYVEPDLLFRGRGAATFEEVLPRSGTSLAELGNSRGLAVGDIDGDGDLDLALSNNRGPLRVLLNNCEPQGHWIMLDVREAAGGVAIGARLEVHLGSTRRHRRVDPSFSYLTANDPRVHFGLGAAESVDAVHVQWLDGSRELFGPLDADAMHELRRGAGRSE